MVYYEPKVTGTPCKWMQRHFKREWFWYQSIKIYPWGKFFNPWIFVQKKPLDKCTAKVKWKITNVVMSCPILLGKKYTLKELNTSFNSCLSLKSVHSFNYDLCFVKYRLSTLFHFKTLDKVQIKAINLYLWQNYSPSLKWFISSGFLFFPDPQLVLGN